MIERLIPIDLFSIAPQLYIFGDKDYKTDFGRILSLLSIVSYVVIITIFLYQLLSRSSVNAITSIINPSTPLSMQLTNKDFYFTFSLEDPMTYGFVIDERIYHVLAFYERLELVNGEEVWHETPLELELCKIEKFNEDFQPIFQNRMQNRYCLKDFNHHLFGTFRDGEYAFIKLDFYECKNTTENSNCASREEIDYYMSGTFVSIELTDVSVDLSNFDKIKQPIIGDIYNLVGNTFFREMHIFLAQAQVETDTGLLFSSIKKESYPVIEKDHEMIVLHPYEKICSITIKMEDKIYYYQRSYLKVYTIMANIGGFVSAITIICQVITYLYVQSKYLLSLSNSLFFISPSKNVDIEKSGFKNKGTRFSTLNFDENKNKLIFTKTINEEKKESNLFKFNQKKCSVAVRGDETSKKKMMMGGLDEFNKKEDFFKCNDIQSNKKNDDNSNSAANINRSGLFSNYKEKVISRNNKPSARGEEGNIYIHKGNQYDDLSANTPEEFNFNHGIGSSHSKAHRKIELSNVEIYLNRFCRKKRSKKISLALFYKAQSIIFEKLDVLTIISEFFNLIRLEKVLLTKEQYIALNLIYKPPLYASRNDYSSLDNKKLTNEKSNYRFYNTVENRQLCFNLFKNQNNKGLVKNSSIAKVLDSNLVEILMNQNNGV